MRRIRPHARVAAVTVLTIAGLSPVVAPAQAGDPATSGPQLVRGSVKELRLGDYDPGSKLLYTPPAAPQGRSSAQVVTASFQVNYDAGFDANPQAKAAFQRAVDIWSQNVTSSVPIVIDADFAPLGPGVLGSAGSKYIVFDTPNARPGTAYGTALANALAGSDTVTDAQDSDGTGEDIVADFASDFPDFYFGTDGNTPAGDIDFVSVVLHEIGHGLGFFGTGTVNNSGQGDIGFDVGTRFVPAVYDRFAEDGLNRSYIDDGSYPRPSAELRQGLEGQRGGAFFDGPKTTSANGGTPARLFAPASFQQGSSYSHFDETTYNNTVNRLMTPSIARGEVAQSPGPLALCLFEDTGWVTPSACGIGGSQRDPAIVSTGLSPASVVTIAGAARSTTVSVRVSDDGPIGAVDVSMYGPEGLAAMQQAQYVSRSGDTELWSAKVFFDRYDAPGSYRVEVDAVDQNGNSDTEPAAAALTVARTALVSIDASPEPVTKGSTIKVTGRVTRLTESGSYVSYTGKRVKLYFRTANSPTYTYLGFTASDPSRGTYTRSYRAEVDGYWKAVSEATPEYARSYAVDYVDVR